MTEAQARQHAKEATIMQRAGQSVVHDASIKAVEYVRDVVLNADQEEARAKILDDHALYMGVAEGMEQIEPVLDNLKQSLKNVDEDIGKMFYKIAVAQLYMEIHGALKKYEE